MSSSTVESDLDPYAINDSMIQAPPASLWRALLKIGPGIILAGSIIGTGELLLTTGLGAEWGFVFLWLILFSCAVKVFIQIELGRNAISCGKPTLTALNELPGPRLGAHWLVWWWFFMFCVTLFQLGAMVGGVAQAIHLAFPAVSPWLADVIEGAWPWLGQTIRDKPEHPWAVLTAFLAVVLLLSGRYKRIEVITTALVVSVTLITVICVLLLPATGYPLRLSDLTDGFSLAIFSLPPAALAAAFSTFGITGVGASELYAYPYWCLEKGYARYTGPNSPNPKWEERARGWLRVMYLDAWVSMVVFTVATVAFYTLGARVLHARVLSGEAKVPAKDKMIETLAEMYVPTFGDWTKVIFLIGAWAVLFKTLYVSSASNSRLTADFLGLAKIVRHRDASSRPRWIRRLCILFPIVSLVLYFLWRDPKVMVIIGGFAQAATLPIISGAAVYMRYFRTDRRLAPSILSDGFLWLAFLLITAFSLYAIPKWAMNDFWPLVKSWF